MTRATPEECDLSGVGVLILALLVEEPMHPYQAFQTLQTRQDTRLVRVSPGAVYHGMERLDRDGLVEKTATERQGRRPERTVYRITEAGRRVLAGHVRLFLGEDLPAYPMFVVGLAEAHVLDAAEVVEALTTRRDRQAADLAGLSEALTRLRTNGIPRRFVLEVEYEAHQIEAEIAWLEGVLADLGAGRIDWTPTTTRHPTPTPPAAASLSRSQR